MKVIFVYILSMLIYNWVLFFSTGCDWRGSERDRVYILNHLDGLLGELKGKKFSCLDELEVKAGGVEINSIEKSHVIVNLIDTECAACYSELEDWKAYIRQDDSILFKNIEVVFIAIGSSNDYFEYVLANFSFPFRVLFDRRDVFLSCNNLHDYARQTFLLDNNYNVVMVGSPLKSDAVLEVYKILIEE